MKNIWILLIWMGVVSLESITYTIIERSFTDSDCYPHHMSLDTHDIIKFIDRTTNYQSWFIPLIWLYWPTKANKRQNRSRKWAVDQLSKSTDGNLTEQHTSRMFNSLDASEDGTRTGDDGTVDSPDRFSNDGYSSLDGD